MVDNDNDEEMGTNVGVIKVEFYLVTELGGVICLGTLQRIPAHAN
jgi:hypothetical protein